MTGRRRGAAGHRTLPHTADLIVEAWGPTRVACLAQAVRGLVAAFADVAGVTATGSVAVAVAGADDEQLLVRLLEEVVYAVEVGGVVPVDVRLEERDGGLAGALQVAPVEAVEVVGPIPKAVTWHGLRVGRDADGWSCRVTVDV